MNFLSVRQQSLSSALSFLAGANLTAEILENINVFGVSVNTTDSGIPRFRICHKCRRRLR